MTRWIRRIHEWTGLFNFTALALFGVVGIMASSLPPHRERAQLDKSIAYRAFDVPGDLDDRQLADHIQKTLAMPFTGPAPDWSLRRDDENNLRFRLPTPARSHEVVVLEDEGRLRIETQPFHAWQYLVHLHELVPSRATPDLRVQVWAWYLELSIWSLILMAVSGVYLWLASRPRHRWARISFALGSLTLIGFYWLVR